MFHIELGWRVKDRITGFGGVVTGRSDYISGCNQYLVQPTELKDGNLIDGRWYDEHRLEVTDRKAVVLPPPVAADPVRTYGADSPAPIK